MPSRTVSMRRRLRQSGQWKKPIVWLVTIALAAAATFVSGVFNSIIGSFTSPDDLVDSISGAAIGIIDVRQNAELTSPFLVDNRDNAELAEQAVLSIDQNVRFDDDWLKRYGAIATDESEWEITFVGRRSEPVEIVDMRTIIEGGRCGAPMAGTAIERLVSIHKGAKEALSVRVDNSRPVFNDLLTGDPFFTGPNAKTITLERDKYKTVTMRAGTFGPHCKWIIALDYVADEKRATMEVRASGGRPFELAGFFPVPPLLNKSQARRDEAIPDAAIPDAADLLGDPPPIDWSQYPTVYSYRRANYGDCSTRRIGNSDYLRMSGVERAQINSTDTVPNGC